MLCTYKKGREMKQFLFIVMLLVPFAVFGGEKVCNYRIDGQKVSVHINDGTSCRKARKRIVEDMAEQKRIAKCIAAGGDEDACWLDTSTYEEDPSPCYTDMECVEKFSHDCYIVRDVINSPGDKYILEWLPEDEEDEEDNFKVFSSLADAESAAAEVFCMDDYVASNCFMSSRETCRNWKESWEASRDYVKWHINNDRRSSGRLLLK